MNNIEKEFHQAKQYVFKDSIFDGKMQPEEKIPLFKSMLTKLYDKSKYGHDEIGILLANLLENEKKGSYLIRKGIAMPHLYINNPKYTDRSGWFCVPSGITYEQINKIAYIFFMCIGAEKFVAQATAYALMIINQGNFLKGALEICKQPTKNEDSIGDYIMSNLLSIHRVNDYREITNKNENYSATSLLVENCLGLHARAAAKLTTMAAYYNCDIYITSLNRKVNAKDIMGVMMLAARVGREITIEAYGKNASNAINGISNLIRNKFHEPY